MDKYEFTFQSTNGTVSKTIIPLKNLKEAFSVRDDAYRHADISAVDFNLIDKKKYPVITLPSNGHPNWMEGARTLCFVYSKHKGNFIIEGYRGEVEEYLKKNYTKYFCYFSMWSHGRSRGSWRFWKDRDVTILEPSKHRKDWKFKVISREPRYSYRQEYKVKAEFHFKRMPNRWIPEFDKL